MIRKLSILAALAAVAWLGTRPGWALDPTYSAGVGGVSRGAPVTAGVGRGTDDGMARLSVPTHSSLSQIGVTPAGVTRGVNKSSNDGFNKAGLAKPNLAGVGRSTMESVPGRSPTYINIVGGVCSPRSQPC